MKNSKILNNQSGLVSFFVVTIIMFVITLIVLAFSQLARREQQQTLERQLSTQAFYAAESGVNDAIDAIASDPTLIDATWPDNCDGFINVAGLNPDLGDGISYSCLLVDVTPPELNYSSVPTNKSVATSIRSEGLVPITQIDISWDDFDGQTNVSGCPDPVSQHSFPGSLPANCLVGGLRLELVPFGVGDPKNRGQLIDTTFIAFAQPRGGSNLNTSTYASGSGDNQGVKTAGGCAGGGGHARYCTLRISSLSPSSNQYYLRMRSVYRPTAVTIRAYTSSGSVNLVGTQAEIDATGRASDVLRRIKVSAPFAVEGDTAPEFAVQSLDTICKRFRIAPPASPSGTPLLFPYTGTGADNGECNPAE